MAAALFCLLFISLLLSPLFALDSCDSKGSVQLDSSTEEYTDKNKTYHPLRVCLFGHWSYVCSNSFNKEDTNIALYQLQCIGDVSSFNISNTPAYLSNIECTGVEQKLTECRRGALSNSSSRKNCVKKVAVHCSKLTNYSCQNGELQNTVGNTLNICANGQWVAMCPNEYLWGAAQARVACRQLHPNEKIIGSNATIVSGATNRQFTYFDCTGEESKLTDCALSGIHQDLCSSIGNTVAGVICELGSQSDTATCSVLPWVSGIVIVFVLNAVILLTVMITFLFLLKRKMTYSKHKLSTANGDHGVVSHMNELYNINGASITKCSPPYEDVEGHWTNSDSVPQDTVEDSDTYGHSNEEMPVNVDSVIAHEEPHYATCEDVLQQKEVYSKLDRVS